MNDDELMRQVIALLLCINDNIIELNDINRDAVCLTKERHQAMNEHHKKLTELELSFHKET